MFDKLNFSPYLQVFELWYQQKLFDGRLRIKLGKVDANTEFSVITDERPPQAIKAANQCSQPRPTYGGPNQLQGYFAYQLTFGP